MFCWVCITESWFYDELMEDKWRIYESVGSYIIIGYVSGLSPIRHQAIIWTNAKLLSILQTFFMKF